MRNQGHWRADHPWGGNWNLCKGWRSLPQTLLGCQGLTIHLLQKVWGHIRHGLLGQHINPKPWQCLSSLNLKIRVIQRLNRFFNFGSFQAISSSWLIQNYTFHVFLPWCPNFLSRLLPLLRYRRCPRLLAGPDQVWGWENLLDPSIHLILTRPLDQAKDRMGRRQRVSTALIKLVGHYLKLLRRQDGLRCLSYNPRAL